jgi:hypothetical protein
MQGFQELSAPLRGYFRDFPVIIIGVLGDRRFLCVDSDGRFQDLVVTEVMSDFRFDFNKKEWVDVDLFKPDE